MPILSSPAGRRKALETSWTNPAPIDIRERKTVDARVKARVKAAVAQNRPAARKP